MKVRVAAPMYVGGIRREVGEIVDLPTVDAVGAIHRGRAERIEEQAPVAPSPGPMTTTSIVGPPAAEPAPEVAIGKKRKHKEQGNVAS
jgi:hypothetical protein